MKQYMWSIISISYVFKNFMWNNSITLCNFISFVFESIIPVWSWTYSGKFLFTLKLKNCSIRNCYSTHIINLNKFINMKKNLLLSICLLQLANSAKLRGEIENQTVHLDLFLCWLKFSKQINTPTHNNPPSLGYEIKEM